MEFRDIEDEVDREIAEERRRAAEWRAERLRFKQKLFGAEDTLDWLAPTQIADFDALLCQHAAQLSNAVRLIMGVVLSDDIKTDTQAKAASTLVRLIQTNVAIARTLNSDSSIAKRKTVRGVPARKDPQD